MVDILARATSDGSEGMALLLMLGVGGLLFILIQVAIVRWIFRINHLVRLLEEIRDATRKSAFTLANSESHA